MTKKEVFDYANNMDEDEEVFAVIYSKDKAIMDRNHICYIRMVFFHL